MPSGMNKVLVTGAQGNVGSEVLRACVAAGLQVRAGVRHETTTTAQVRFDFFDRSTWKPALADCESMFLLRPPPIADMDATLNPFIDEAYAAGVKHVVFLSVSGAERMAWVPHRKVERHLEATANGWTILRPGFFAQNLQDAYRRDIVEDGRLYVPAGSGQVAFVDARDIGEVAATVLGDPSSFLRRALTLTGPEAITFEQVAEVLTAALGTSIRYESASLSGYAWHLRARRGMAWAQVAVQTYLHWGLRRGDASVVEPTVERLLQRPAGTLSAYVARSISLWR